jgi:hypothetical protein
VGSVGRPDDDVVVTAIHARGHMFDEKGQTVVAVDKVCCR